MGIDLLNLNWSIQIENNIHSQLQEPWRRNKIISNSISNIYTTIEFTHTDTFTGWNAPT